MHPRSGWLSVDVSRQTLQLFPQLARWASGPTETSNDLMYQLLSVPFIVGGAIAFRVGESKNKEEDKFYGRGGFLAPVATEKSPSLSVASS